MIDSRNRIVYILNILCVCASIHRYGLYSLFEYSLGMLNLVFLNVNLWDAEYEPKHHAAAMSILFKLRRSRAAYPSRFGSPSGLLGLPAVLFRLRTRLRRHGCRPFDLPRLRS